MNPTASEETGRPVPDAPACKSCGRQPHFERIGHDVWIFCPSGLCPRGGFRAKTRAEAITLWKAFHENGG